MAEIPCPFVYADGRCCRGRVTRIATFKADIEWREAADGAWQFYWADRTHYHLFCSERGNHSGVKKNDDERMKFYYRELPPELQAVINGTTVQAAAPTPQSTMT